MSNENPVYVNELIVTFEGDDQNNVSWSIRADDSVRNSLHASMDELARAGAPLSAMGIRALYEILGENLINLALEKGNLYQCREYIRGIRGQSLPEAEGVEGVMDGDVGEGIVVH